MKSYMTLPVSLGIVGGIVAVGTGGLLAMDVMATDTVMMMVLPSMVAFALVVFVVGTLHGQQRAA